MLISLSRRFSRFSVDFQCTRTRGVSPTKKRQQLRLDVLYYTNFKIAEVLSRLLKTRGVKHDYFIEHTNLEGNEAAMSMWLRNLKSL